MAKQYTGYSGFWPEYDLNGNDKENDFILCMDNGRVFDIEKLDKPIVGGKHNRKTAIEVYGWNREELMNFRLDIVSEWQEPIDEEKLRKEIEEYAENMMIIHCKEHHIDCPNHIIKDALRRAYEAGYRKSIENKK